MKRLTGLLAIPALAATGACAPPAGDARAEAAFDARASANACWIEVVEVAGQTMLEVYAAPGLRGSYELTLRQNSGSGDAVITQSDQFVSAGNAPERLSQLSLGGSAGFGGASLGEMMASMRNAQPGTTIISSDGAGRARYDIRVRLMDERGREICAAERAGP